MTGFAANAEQTAAEISVPIAAQENPIPTPAGYVLYAVQRTRGISAIPAAQADPAEERLPERQLPI